jgi:hypothetical protein
MESVNKAYIEFGGLKPYDVTIPGNGTISVERRIIQVSECFGIVIFGIPYKTIEKQFLNFQFNSRLLLQ